MGKYDRNITTISIWDSLGIRLLSFILAFWVSLKLCTMWIFNANNYFRIENRDNPPGCLVDTSIGQHKYVKLKVFIDLLIN